MNCKHCGSANCYKNGFRNGKQNRKCKDCGRNFTEGDNRRTDRAKEKAVCFLLYTMGRASMRFLADIFQVSVRTIHVWIKDMADSTPNPAVGTAIEEIEIDEMWYYLQKKLESYGRSRRLTVSAGELSPGLRAVVILQRYGDTAPS